MTNAMYDPTWRGHVPTRTEALNVARDLSALWDRSKTKVAIPIIDGRQLSGLGAYVLARHAVETSDAIVALFEQDMELQAIPLIRTVMESAINAAWLVTTENSGSAALNYVANQRIKLLNSLHTSVSQPEGVDSGWEQIKIESEEFSTHEARHFEQRCNSLQGGDGVYAIYRLLSEVSHPNLGLIESYTKANPAGEPSIAIVDSHLQGLDNIFLAVHVSMLAIAMSAWGQVDETPDLLLKVRTIGQRYGLETRLAAKKASHRQ